MRSRATATRIRTSHEALLMGKVRSQTVKELFALYGVQIASMLLPLAMLPLLSRVLGAEEFGKLLVVQSIFLMLFIVIEYGFAFSGSRRVAENNSDPQALSECVASVMGAKCLLTAVYFVVSLITYVSLSVLHDNKLLFVSGLLYGLVQGWSPLWFFQGLGRSSQYVLIDIALRIVSLIAIFIFVRSPSDSWMVLMLQTIGLTLSLVFGLCRIYCRVRFKFPSFARVLETLRVDRGMFLFRVMAASLSTLNTVILAYLGSATAVAYYSSADRMAAGVRSVNIPFNQAFLVKIAASAKTDYGLARQYFRRSFKIMFLLNSALSLVFFAAAPLIVPFVLGEDFSASIKIFQLILVASPLFVLGNALGMQWMIPNHMDSQYNKIVLVAAIVNLLLMIYLVPLHGPYGVVCATILSEMLICTIILTYLTVLGVNPFQNNPPLSPKQTKEA